ncbi:MAG: Flp pilus assembly complex ATPase component TadA, partial [Deltaproteobacteria bacterium]|nr:Flp pilus assembly complex ATPase component TadA [Deltaproteobacteria bacterium]
VQHDLTSLVRTTMRLKPDRIIIGELRGGETGAAQGLGHRPSRFVYDHPCRLRRRGVAAARRAGAGSRRAAAAAPHLRDHSSARGHRADAVRPVGDRDCNYQRL